MSIFDSIGDLVSGTVLSKTVEPDTGESADFATGPCLNCGAQLNGRFCSNCGQKGKVNRSLTAFFGDMAQQLLDFEGKVWRTLPMLAWKPGVMTRRYIDGERAKFVSPIALYIFSVFIMFATLSFNRTLEIDENSMRPDVVTEAASPEEAIAQLEEAREGLAASGVDLSMIDEQLAEQQAELEQAQEEQAGDGSGTAEAEATDADNAGSDKVEISDQVRVDLGTEEENLPDEIREGIQRIRDDPQAFVNRVQDAASKYSWMLIPLSLPFVWLLFPFSRRFKFYDHTVFVTYSLSFMMFLVVLASLFVALGWTTAASLLWLLPPIHMYKHLKNTYQIGWFSTLIRTFLLVIASFIVMFIFALIMGAIGALT